MRNKSTRAFRLSEKFISQYAEKEVPWGPVGYVVFKRTYARRLDENNPAAGTEEWHQTCRRVTEGTFTMQKKHCISIGVPWNDAKAQATAKIFYDRLFNLKWTPPGRGLWMMGTDFVENRTAAGLFNCLEFNTPVLTDKGYKKIGTLAGTSPTILTSTGKWVQAPVRSFGKQKLMKIELARYRNETKTIYATPEHRWFIRSKYDAAVEEVLTEDLEVGDYMQMVFGQGIKNVTPSPQGIQHGIVYGDGTVEPTGGARVVLVGTKDKTLSKYFPLNTQLEYDNLCAEDAIVVRGLPAAYKAAPSWEEGRAYRTGFLMGYFAADGCVTPEGSASISSTDKKSLELFKNIAATVGIGTSRIRAEERISNLTGRPSTLYQMSLVRETLDSSFFLIESHRENFCSKNLQKRPRAWRVTNVTATDREEEVFCATVENYGNFVLEDHILTGNCAFRSTKDIAEKGGYLFQWMMDALMVGIGVGFDCLGSGTMLIQQPGSKYPTPDIPANPQNIYNKVAGEWWCTIADSREGWVESVRVLLNAFYFGYELPQFDYELIRPAGSPIKGFGGTSSGHAPLQDMHESLIELYEEAVGNPISDSNIVDTQNLIGRCVVAGNVRRSAALAIGLPTSKEFISLKDPTQIHEWEAQLAELSALENNEFEVPEHMQHMDTEEVRATVRAELQGLIANHPLRHHRWGSNNSLDVSAVEDFTPYAELTVKNGEPGYIWLENARTRGRFKDPKRSDDLQVMGFNPCVEQQLEDAELCCLVETYPWLHDSYEDYLITLKIAYLYAKTVTLARTQWPETNAIMQKNRRIGLSMSGFQQARDRHGAQTMYDWCDDAYGYLKTLDKKYSDWLCIPRSKRMTSIKPSGTVSKLNGSNPGIHFPENEYYIQRIRFAEGSEIAAALEAAGYPVEPCVYSPNTVVACFPIKEKNFVRGKKDVSMWEQLEIAAQMQYYWADNSVSVTVTFQDHEASSIPAALSLYSKRLKAVSFLRYQETGYAQAPYTPCTAEEYEALAAQVQPLQRIAVKEQGVGERFCSNDTCTL